MSYKYNFRMGADHIKTKVNRNLSTISIGITTVMIGTVMPLSAVAAASATTIYNDIPTQRDGNYPSQPYEAQSVSEFGGQVQFDGTVRQNPKVTVLMSSWGCQTGNWTSNTCTTTPGSTFSEPITLNVYSVNTDNTPATKLATTTKTFSIPFRPSTNTVCGDGRWSSDGTLAHCYNGFATPITFDLTGITLPNKAIISLAYNTTHYGNQPYGESASCFNTTAGCGYDSLNVAVTGIATTGSQPAPADAYLNSSFGGFYCDGGQGGTDTFRLDSGCWTGFQPMFKVVAGYNNPTNKDDCKKDGYKDLTDADGNSFKNQGQCVSYTNGRGQ